MSETTSFPYMGSSLETVRPFSSSGMTTYAMGVGGMLTDLSSFNPSTLTGLILWLDASKIAGIVSGTSLSAWTDSSASLSHATQPSAGSQPIYLANAQNGNGVVSWATGGKAFMRSATSVSQNWTYAAAMVSRATTGNHDIIADGTNAPLFDNGVNYASFAGSLVIGSLFTSNAWVDLIVQLSGSSTTLTVSGVTVFGNAGAGTGVLTNLGSLTAASQWLNGSIGEVAVYSRLLSESERNSLDTYLRSKWATL